MTILAPEERTQALQVIGAAAPDVVAADVARLYKCPINQSNWEYTGICGAVMLVIEKQGDIPFVKIVDLKSNTLAFEQECYPGFEFSQLTNFFFCFEGDDGVYGLNFAEGADAIKFTTTSKMILASLATNVVGAGAGDTSPKTPTKTKDAPAQKKEGGFFSRIFGKKKEEPVQPKRPTISAVKNVVHVSHIGFTPGQGFQLRDIPEEWKHIFEEAGVTEEDLKDKKTAAFLMKTIATVSAPPPPPPPAQEAKAAPPPPPQSKAAPPPPSAKPAPPPPPSAGAPPPPPAPPSLAPPPPPPPSGGPPPPPSGGPPSPTPSSTMNSSGGDLLAQIKAQRLNKVSTESMPEVQKMSNAEKSDLAMNIKMAMQMRRAAVVSDDEDDDDDW